jgi:hypothetical protein
MDRRRQLADVVTGLAWMIAVGDLDLVPREIDTLQTSDPNKAISIENLQEIAQLCDARHLPMEAARIRRWLTP